MKIKTRSIITPIASLLILFSSLMIIGQTKEDKTNYLITPTSVGDIELGMTVKTAKKISDGLMFERDFGSENSLVISVKKDGKQILIIGADEGVEADENGNAPPINENAKIYSIQILDPRFKTEKGVHIGSKVEEVEKQYGKLKEIFFDQHVGEMGDFTDLPKGIRFDLAGKNGTVGEAGDYVGAEPQDYGQRTKKYKAGAIVASIMVETIDNEPAL